MAATTASTTAPIISPDGEITVLGQHVPIWPALVGAVLALIVATVIVRLLARVLRGKKAADTLTVVAAAMASSVAATGMWHFFTRTMHLPVWIQAVLFAFMEVSVLASAMRARANVSSDGQAGVDGLAVWVLTSASGFMSATEAASVQEAVVRLGAPLVAAWLWERSMVPERRAQRKRAAAAAGGRSIESALAQIKRNARERILARLGVTAPDKTALELSQDKALTQVVRLTKKIGRIYNRGPLGRAIGLRLGRAEARWSEAMLKSGAPADSTRQEMIVGQLAVLQDPRDLASSKFPSPWEPFIAALSTAGAREPQPGPEDGHTSRGMSDLLPGLAALVLALTRMSQHGSAQSGAVEPLPAGVNIAPQPALKVDGYAAPIFLAPAEPADGKEPANSVPVTSDDHGSVAGCDVKRTVGTHGHPGLMTADTMIGDEVQARAGRGTGDEDFDETGDEARGTGDGGKTRTSDENLDEAGDEARALTGDVTGDGGDARTGDATGDAAGSRTGDRAQTGDSGETQTGDAAGSRTGDRAQTGDSGEAQTGDGGPAAKEGTALSRRGGGRGRSDEEMEELVQAVMERLGGPPLTVEQIRTELKIGKGPAARVRKMVNDLAQLPEAEPSGTGAQGTADDGDAGTGDEPRRSGIAGTVTGAAAVTDPDGAGPGTVGTVTDPETVTGLLPTGDASTPQPVADSGSEEPQGTDPGTSPAGAESVTGSRRSTVVGRRTFTEAARLSNSHLAGAAI